MTQTQWKDFFRAIRKNIGRFFSLVFIVAIGVAFYSGIRSTEPDMRISADKTYDEYKFLDIWIRSNLGLTRDDISEIAGRKDVETAEGGYLTEAFLKSDNSKDPNEEHVTQVYSTSKNLNKLNIKEGRLPEGKDECFIDHEFMEKQGLKIGDIVKIADGDGNKVSALKTNEFKIAGSGSFSWYLSWERGSASIGDGTNDTFIFTSPDAFDLDCYTIAYVRVSGSGELDTYSKEYADKIDNVRKDIESIANGRASKRLDDIRGEGLARIEDGRKKIDDGRKALADGQAQIDAASLDLDNGYREYENGLAQYNAGMDSYNAGLARIRSTKNELDDSEAEYSAGEAQIDKLREQLKAAKASGNTQMAMVLEGKISKGARGLAATREQLNAGWKEYNSGVLQLNANKDKLDASKAALDDTKTRLDNGKAELEVKKADLEAAKAKSEKEIAEAEADVAKAEKDLNSIGESKWYVLTRDQIMTYVEFKMDSERIGKIGTVFPAIFFLVAALVCLTSMTRMIEEERTLIGTMKAMGVSSAAIAGKYFTYAAAATLGGGILGALVGAKILPYVIILAYKILYVNLDIVVLPYHADLFITSILFALIATVGATIMACMNALRSTPAALMRPPAPKSGKRIILEKIPFIWNRLSFNLKSAIRNLFRYKKRFFMSILGIGGCMSLLLVSFGLHDSIMTIVDNQYDKIWSYNASADINKDIDLGSKRELIRNIRTSNTEISNSLMAYSQSTKITCKDKEEDAFLFVPEDKENVGNFINLKTRDNKINNEFKLEDGKVIITEKFANLLGLKVGDDLPLEVDGKIKKVNIGHISENYLYHYVYMTENTYRDIYGKSPEFNVVYLRFNNTSNETNEKISKSLLDMKNIKGVTMINELQAKVNNMMSSLNYVVIVLVLSAGLLVYVVTYNLNNINISERRRELASLKVLGMHNIEVANYIYRENIFLTSFGVVVGLFMGLFLHQYVIRTAEIDMLMFGRHINLVSYFFAAGLTFLFAIIVNVLMFWRIKKIDVVESMKSVE
ncbi:MAG: FtsX-like permease family protein [Clostridiales bacterium]|nr:FtsX-like permease family protein [Clostridiales bacterium]